MPTVFEKLSTQLDILDSIRVINITDPTDIRKPVEVFSAVRTILRYNENDIEYTLDCYGVQDPLLYSKSKLLLKELQQNYPLFFKPIPLSKRKRLFKFKRRNEK